VPLRVYGYPDPPSKKQLMGNAGSGNAVPSSRTLHVLQLPAAQLVSMEGLMDHEGTHVLAYYAWGPAGTALMGEGLAVWVKGGYAAHTLEGWKANLTAKPDLKALLGTGWTKLKEPQKYPPAGIFVAEAIRALGADNVRDHLLSATFDAWGNACKAAGTTPEAMATLLAKALDAQP
jgi:hypothetical protein